MSTVTFQQAPVQLTGQFVQVGQTSPDFTVVGGDLADITKASLVGKNVVLSFFPSVDTGVCAMGMRKFNEAAASVADTVIIGISQDLPFAAGRFCAAEGIEAVKTGSTFRNNEVLEAFGVKIAEGALANISARAVVVLDKDSKIVHAELVGEITEEPNYEAALASLK
ncbi:thiol peroxidase [Marinicellulosiphila megalodicopiae]|uniref:thiol peroxidase n=1 Tax=Marinicellulosiphila megalodicopiae TaxID=2724896 RepID=UPI003BB1E534